MMVLPLLCDLLHHGHTTRDRQPVGRAPLMRHPADRFMRV
jgi:hypothetical protein